MIRHVTLWNIVPGENRQGVIEILNTLPANCRRMVGSEIDTPLWPPALPPL